MAPEALDRWTADLQPGDPCSVWWQGKAWEARLHRGEPREAVVMLVAGAGVLVPMAVRWDDVMPPGHVWVL